MIVVNRETVINNPDQIKEIAKEAKATLELCKRCELLLQLRKYQDWGRFDWALMVQWANPVDEPFIKLMLSLSKHGYKYGAISMHRWWRRLKAVNQQHLITYFSYVGFQDNVKSLYWLDLYAQCCRTKDMFQQFSAQYNNDSAVEMNLRALLGISQKTDIKEAWTKWAKANHPDKGGSVEKFVLVKAAYEEWHDSHS